MSVFRELMMTKKQILYAPKLDGSEAITTMQNQRTPYITNNTLTGYFNGEIGGSGYLSEGWDNTGLWELTFKGRGVGNSAILFACNTTKRDYNLINITEQHHWRYNGSSPTTFSYSPSITSPTLRNIVITKIDSTTVTIKVDNGSAVTISGFTPLSQTDRCYIGVDAWVSNSYAIIRNILVRAI